MNTAMNSTMTTLTIREADVLERQATHLIGTLGHVSEGKSTLIRALTGIKTQRHQKEQERNITIHLGYANCKVYQHNVTGEIRATKTSDQSPGSDWILTAHLSMVDCPGHEAFLATMLGGASIMDTACLIIASNQEVIPQPQTLEHLIAAELMGLKRIAVVQNKLDLITPAAATENYDKINTFREGSVAESAPVFPISAQHGWGVGEVLNYIMSLPPPGRNLHAPARLTCVRSFDINKPQPFVAGKTELTGAVIGGTLEQGVLAVGDWIEIRPGILKRDSKSGKIVGEPILTRVRGIRCESAELPYAVPGSLIAIATDLDPGLSIANGMVGQRMGAPGTLPPIVDEIMVRFHSLKRDAHSFSKARKGDKVKICSNVMTVEGTIIDMEKKYRRIRLDRPICVDIGENVGILRLHAEAGRELLEGSAEVREIVAMPGRYPEGYAEARDEIAVQKARTIEWIPLEKPDFTKNAVMPYAELLDAVMSHKEEVMGSTSSRLRLKDPAIERIPKHTVWVNWNDTVTALDAGKIGDILYRDHFHTYLDAELTTTSTVNGQTQLVMKGFWKVDDLRFIVRKYIGKFKRCKQCEGYDTGLVKESRSIKVRCTRCITDSFVDV